MNLKKNDEYIKKPIHNTMLLEEYKQGRQHQLHLQEDTSGIIIAQLSQTVSTTKQNHKTSAITYDIFNIK